MSSPRTAAEPMAFTRGEWGRGAVAAWVIFLMLLLGALFVLFAFDAFQQWSRSGSMPLGSSLWFTLIMLGYAAVIGGGIGLLVMALGMPVAWLLGRSLRTVRSQPVHLLVYTALGLAASVVGVGAMTLMFGGGSLDGPITWIVAVAATLAVPLGWWHAACRALRQDRGLIAPGVHRPDPDALAEDEEL